MSRYNNPLFFLLLFGYQASSLASPPQHIRHQHAPHHNHKTKSPRRAAKPSYIHVTSPRSMVINTLMAQLGRPYQWGGASPDTGFDCSGLVWYVWKKNFRVRLPRTAEGMYNMPQAHPIQFKHLQPGDMVFFSMRGEHIDHVGVYVGKGRFIEAPHTGENVKIADIEKGNYLTHYKGARRFMPLEKAQS
ncbi:C40 family peptidase [Enterobacter hormaechei]|uniref:C40 family peptidase n=1 Tax=Enterobacter hormaechei TaxID=158836 RepID=UPI0032DA27FB